MKNYKFIKRIELTATGEEVTYWTEIDGLYISGSTSTDESVAKNIFNEIVKKNVPARRTETLIELNA